MDKGGTLMIQTDTAEPEDCQLANKIKPEESECFSTEALIECDEPEATGVLRPDEVEPKKEPKEPPVERPKRKSKLPRITHDEHDHHDHDHKHPTITTTTDSSTVLVGRCPPYAPKKGGAGTVNNQVVLNSFPEPKLFQCDQCRFRFLTYVELQVHFDYLHMVSASQMKEAQTPPVGLPLAATLLANATKSQRLQAPPSSTASTPGE
ncbi:unnamed protein product [Schistocephalus solidus]|uniref:C2H2-type domain-containing protein n=1 Tax=Schistocephalus solidus TaxID=70667 RepID=A0A183TFE3_SCHSO|nr:unnamed protein product [Schistocephalus solidus]